MGIFASTDDFRTVCPQLGRTFDFAVLQVTVEQAAQIYLQPFLGDALIDDLIAKNTAGGLSAEETKAFNLLATAVGNYTYMDLITTHGVKVVDRGVQESYADDSSSRPANHYQRNDARLMAANRGDLYVDRLLNYLEETVVNDSTKFQLWQGSEAYSNIFDNFIWSFNQIKQYIQGVKSRRILYTMSPQIKWVQQRDLKPLLGETLFDALLLAIKSRPTTPLAAETQAIIDKIQPWLAVTAFMEALPSLRIQFREGGIHYLTYDGPLTKSMTTANNDGIRHLTGQLQERSAGAWSTFTRWLDNNLADYPGANATGTLLNDEFTYPPKIYSGRGSLNL